MYQQLTHIHNMPICLQVRVDGDEYIHLRVFKSFQQSLSLTSYQEDLTAADPLKYF